MSTYIFFDRCFQWFVVVFDFPFDEGEEIWAILLEGGVAKNTFGSILAGFVKAIHIELSDEWIDFGVSEVLGEDDFLELVDVPDDEFPAGGGPENNFTVVGVLNLRGK